MSASPPEPTDSPTPPEPAPPGMIPVKSRRQAMDYGLVLMSQGIESVIQRSPESGEWGLVVEPKEFARAVQALRLYRVENRHWHWPEQFRWPAMGFDWWSVAWALALAAWHWVCSVNPGLRAAGELDGHAFASGQWWRLFTAITLHADLAHLATNLSIGVVLLGLAMGRYGAGVALPASFLAGAAGNGASLLFHGQNFRGLGASGMIMGALGLLAAQSLTLTRGGWKQARRVGLGVAAGFMLFVLFGLSPGSDIAAHLGGFVCGLGLGALLVLAPQETLRGRRVSLTASAVTAGLVAVAWGLAVRTR